MPRLVLLLACCVLLNGCYYLQAAQGQWELTRKREPIDEILARSDTPPELVARLRLVEEARQFAVDELALPDNDTYRTYADLERDYVLWNVFAAPEFSLEPKTWCFPVAGCVAYRGYFSKEAADREAARLAADGYDVAVGGVAAYSTLGRFKDPVLNTMMNWDDARLVAVLFHELAHQVVYVKDDTAFNESFATAVEEFGLQRWLAAKGADGEMSRYASRRRLSEDIMDLVSVARSDLETLYTSSLPDDEKRRMKKRRFASLAEHIAARLEEAGSSAGHWLASDPNNARLVPMVLYEGHLPAFEALIASCNGELDCFYAAVERLAKLPRSERDNRLERLVTP
ncbi:MAG: aminopeptidase [Woeseiaceae bacterium]|nr:aminopeptidase [Woeseiaceae bacterium]